jgi:hypothetical protein
MSELLNACKALAAMVRDHGQPTIDEVNFVAHSALELGLDPDQNGEVQDILKDGGDFNALIADIESPDVRVFLFRRIVEATLLDDQINDAEKQYISSTAKSFGYVDEVAEEFIAWMRDGMEWEKRGVAIIERM